MLQTFRPPHLSHVSYTYTEFRASHYNLSLQPFFIAQVTIFLFATSILNSLWIPVALFPSKSGDICPWEAVFSVTEESYFGKKCTCVHMALTVKWTGIDWSLGSMCSTCRTLI